MAGEKRVNEAAGAPSAPKRGPGRPRAAAAAASSATRRKPKLGQNFLRDESAARRIVAALGDLSPRTVIEIGPGQGILTELLAKSARRLIAIELDRILTAQLRMQYSRHPNVEVLEADVLDVNFPALLSRRPGPLLLPRMGEVPHERADVVGNLPYYITSDILLRLFSFHHWLETIVIMVQREVADRIAARPGTRDYGVLSATAQLHGRVEKLFTLPPGAFAPPPKVHSTVLLLRIAPRWNELRVAREPFIAFLRQSFAQKRKTLANNLKSQYPDAAIAAALRAARLRADVRAEAISLEQAAAVFQQLGALAAAAATQKTSAD